MNEMIGRVAQALLDASALKIDASWDDSEYYVNLAVEAIKAMRKPTEEMIYYVHLYSSNPSKTVKEIYEAMINEALK